MHVTLIDIVLFILFFQLLTLVPYLLFQSGSKSLSNKLLAAFLMAKALCISAFLAFRLYDVTLQFFPHAFYFGSSFTIAWGPLLFLYIKSITISGNKLTAIDYLHFTPFLVHLLYLSITFHIHSVETKREIIESGNLFSAEMQDTVTLFTQVSILIYTVAAFILVQKYHKAVKQNCSNTENLKLNWVYLVLLGFGFKWLFDISYITTTSIFEVEGTVVLALSRLALFIFINILFFKSLKHPFLTQDNQLPVLSGKKTLSTSRKQRYKEMLLSYMEQHKPYMDPDLTLNDLANSISIPTRSLSEVINDELGQNFYDFINGYRIKASQVLLTEERNAKKTVLEVLYEVGFNSKSAFNNAFKKKTGMTPSQYRRALEVSLQ